MGATPGRFAAAQAHHPALVMDKDLHLTIGAHTLEDVLHEHLPLVRCARRQEGAAADKGHMRDSGGYCIHGQPRLHEPGFRRSHPVVQTPRDPGRMTHQNAKRPQTADDPPPQ